ncbi:adenylyl-sulfate kinase [Nocardioides sp. C4-1]|uniref:adenylyl-sulfate kinase n=1 Tax=Nocardioides sp. C4-1 TaxID=3151851 RepID=UPI0032661DC6
MSSPQHCPSPRELDDLELLTSGALTPLTAFDVPGSPVTLDLPEALAAEPTVELVDPEGLPLALAHRDDDGSRRVEALTHPQHGPFRRLYLTPAQVRAQHAERTVVPVTDAVTDAQLDQLQSLGPVTLLALVGHGTPGLSPVALLRATLRVAASLDAVVVAVPLASHGDADVDHDLGVQVVTTYAGGDPVVGLVDDGEPLAELADIVDADRPAPDRQGLVLFFTGLSGSGKSTLARALMDRLLEQGHRTVTTLDGDVVRRHLSAGLTFSKADRETNIRRIGWVAAEISRHGGVAVCSPIAPFDETRQQVRAMVDEAGGAFFLVHVATPLEECERRDRKGLYAKARRGEIPEFTGISSPYEAPDDADVVVDTTGRTIDDALGDVLDELAVQGYLDLRPTPAEAVDDQRPLRVLFVCTANICRSPTMEVVARRIAGPVATSGVEFSSAGAHGWQDAPMNPPLAAAALRHGADPADVEAFRSRPLTRELLDDADLVVTAEATHRQFVLDDHPEAFRKVFTLGQLAEAVRQAPGDLDRDALLQSIGERRGPASTELDVPDPYGRGDEAAESCATLVDAYLTTVVPRLRTS